MKGDIAGLPVQGYEVLYASDDDSFRTVQVNQPVPGRFYKPIEVRAVILEGIKGWRVDASDPIVPKVVNGTGGSKSLNTAVREGLVRVSTPLNLRNDNRLTA